MSDARSTVLVPFSTYVCTRETGPGISSLRSLVCVYDVKFAFVEEDKVN